MIIDILDNPIIHIEDDIVLSDRRILGLYMYKLLAKFSNCCLVKDVLYIDGCKVVLRTDAKTINLHPSYQKGTGRHETEEGFNYLKQTTDLFVLIKVIEGGVRLIPMLASDCLTSRIKSEDFK